MIINHNNKRNNNRQKVFSSHTYSLPERTGMTRQKAKATTNNTQTEELTTKGGEKLYKAEPNAEIDELYRHYSILDNAGENAGSHVDSYTHILNAVRSGSDRAKMLACQFIPKFFKYFDKLASQAINAQLDLCEEESRDIRIWAIRGLPMICQDKKEHVSHISNVLGQLLIVDDKVELDAVKDAFLQLFRTDTKAALKTLFQQIQTPEQDDEKMREQAILFLKEKVMPLAPELINPYPDIEKYVATEIEKLLPKASQKEFADYISILQSLPIFHDTNGKKLLLDKIIQQSPLTSIQVETFDIKDVNTLKKVLYVINVSTPLFRSLQQTGPFFQFLVLKVLPKLDDLEQQLKMEVLRAIAISSPTASASDARTALPIIYQKFMDSIKPEAELNFAYLECYLYTFLQIAQKVPGSLNKICGIKIVTGQPEDDLGDYSEKKEQMLKALTSLEQRCKKYKDTLIQVLKASAASSEEDKTKTDNGEKKTEQAEKTIDPEQAKITKRILNNLLRMVHKLMAMSKKPTFFKFNDLILSWIEKKDKKRSASETELTEKSEKRQRQASGKRGLKEHGKNQGFHKQGGRGRGGGRRGSSRGRRGGGRF